MLRTRSKVLNQACGAMLPSPCSLTQALTFCSRRTNLSQVQRAIRSQLLVSSGGPLLAPRSDDPLSSAHLELCNFPFSTRPHSVGLMLPCPLPQKGHLLCPQDGAPRASPAPGGPHEPMESLRPDSVTSRSTVLVTEKIWQEEVIAETKKKKKNQKSVYLT